MRLTLLLVLLFAFAACVFAQTQLTALSPVPCLPRNDVGKEHHDVTCDGRVVTEAHGHVKPFAPRGGDILEPGQPEHVRQADGRVVIEADADVEKPSTTLGDNRQEAEIRVE